MIEEQGGGYVVNIQDADWYLHPVFGLRCMLEKSRSSFPEVGVNLVVLQPGKPACRYHRENAQEDFLVLSGECQVLMNGEMTDLKTWDFVHCPAGVTHVFIGAGAGPCALLMIGHRRGEDHQLFYPDSDIAKQYNAESPEPTEDPQIAYSDVMQSQKTEAPDWLKIVR